MWVLRPGIRIGLGMTDSRVISDFSEMWLAVTDSVGVGGEDWACVGEVHFWITHEASLLARVAA